MRGLEDKLTWRQEKAVTALLTHATVPAAAKACGIGEATLWRWLQQPVFQQRYQTAQRQTMTDAVNLLQKASASAVGVLVTVMRDDTKPASVRVNAAVRVLDYAFKGKELLELEERLSHLEEELPQILQQARREPWQ